MSVKVGDKAPDFTLPSDGGGKVSLKALKGKSGGAVFLPQGRHFGLHGRSLVPSAMLCPTSPRRRQQIIGISRDSVASHDKFKTKYGLTFPLASDEDGKVCEAYGTWVEKSMYGRKYMGIERATFLIDAKGVIRNIWRKVKVPGHAEEVLEAAAALD